MTFPTLRPEVIAALRSAGATEEIIAAAVKASGELRTPHPGGRPRKHANEAERARQYRKRKKRHETSSVTGDEICRIAVLRVCLEGAAAGHFDPGAGRSDDTPHPATRGY